MPETEYAETLEDFVARIGDALGITRKPKPPKRRFPWPAGPWRKYNGSFHGRDGERIDVLVNAQRQVMELAPVLAEAAVEYYEWCNTADGRRHLRDKRPRENPQQALYDLGLQIKRDIMDGCDC